MRSSPSEERPPVLDRALNDRPQQSPADKGAVGVTSSCDERQSLRDLSAKVLVPPTGDFDISTSPATLPADKVTPSVAASAVTCRPDQKQAKLNQSENEALQSTIPAKQQADNLTPWHLPTSVEASDSFAEKNSSTIDDKVVARGNLQRELLAPLDIAVAGLEGFADELGFDQSKDPHSACAEPKDGVANPKVSVDTNMNSSTIDDGVVAGENLQGELLTPLDIANEDSEGFSDDLGFYFDQSKDAHNARAEPKDGALNPKVSVDTDIKASLSTELRPSPSRRGQSGEDIELKQNLEKRIQGFANDMELDNADTLGEQMENPCPPFDMLDSKGPLAAAVCSTPSKASMTARHSLGGKEIALMRKLEKRFEDFANSLVIENVDTNEEKEVNPDCPSDMLDLEGSLGAVDCSTPSKEIVVARRGRGGKELALMRKLEKRFEDFANSLEIEDSESPVEVEGSVHLEEPSIKHTSAGDCCLSTAKHGVGKQQDSATCASKEAELDAQCNPEKKNIQAACHEGVARSTSDLATTAGTTGNRYTSTQRGQGRPPNSCVQKANKESTDLPEKRDNPQMLRNRTCADMENSPCSQPQAADRPPKLTKRRRAAAGRKRRKEQDAYMQTARSRLIQLQLMMQEQQKILDNAPWNKNS